MESARENNTEMRMRVTVESPDGGVYIGEAVLQKQGGRGSKATIAATKPTRKKRTCSAAVRLLWQKGHFREPLSFAQVKTALRQLDCNFPDNTLAMALGSPDYLTRRGKRGNYAWVQKYPYGG